MNFNELYLCLSAPLHASMHHYMPLRTLTCHYAPYTPLCSTTLSLFLSAFLHTDPPLRQDVPATQYPVCDVSVWLERRYSCMGLAQGSEVTLLCSDQEGYPWLGSGWGGMGYSCPGPGWEWEEYFCPRPRKKVETKGILSLRKQDL